MAQGELNFGDRVFSLEMSQCNVGAAPYRGIVLEGRDPDSGYALFVTNRLSRDGTRRQMVRIHQPSSGPALVYWLAQRWERVGGNWSDSRDPDAPADKRPLIELGPQGISFDVELTQKEAGETRSASISVVCPVAEGERMPEHWLASIDGNHQGPIAVSSVSNGMLEQVTFYNAPGSASMVSIDIRPLGRQRIIAVGGSLAEVEVLFLNEYNLFSGIRKSYVSGQGADDGYTPKPPLVNISGITPFNVTGSVTGTLWRAYPAPGDPSDTASVNIEFTARACHRQGPEYSRCMDPQEPWP